MVYHSVMRQLSKAPFFDSASGFTYNRLMQKCRLMEDVHWSTVDSWDESGSGDPTRPSPLAPRNL
jgi:hypothetical protein